MITDQLVFYQLYLNVLKGWFIFINKFTLSFKQILFNYFSLVYDLFTLKSHTVRCTALLKVTDDIRSAMDRRHVQFLYHFNTDNETISSYAFKQAVKMSENKTQTVLIKHPRLLKNIDSTNGPYRLILKKSLSTLQ